VAQRKCSHGVTKGCAVELLDHGKPSRSRSSATVLYMGTAGFLTQEHPGTCLWFRDINITWRPRSRPILEFAKESANANPATVGNTDDPPDAA
jgi:hypothetical protein